MGFLEAGYALLEGLLDDDALTAIRHEAAARSLAPSESSCIRPNNTLLSLRWDDPIVRRILASRSRIDAIAASVGATDLRWISGYVSVKDAHSPPLAWHRDWWCWDHPASFRPAPVQVAVLCYLTDTDAGNGAFRVLPGSHHRSAAVEASLPEAHGDATAELAADHVALAELPDQVTLGVQAGDAVVIDYRLLHGTHANGTDARRDCILLSFAPAWSSLPDDLRAHLICHPALPGDGEAPADSLDRSLLPDYTGVRRSLSLNRVPPATFTIA